MKTLIEKLNALLPFFLSLGTTEQIANVILISLGIISVIINMFISLKKWYAEAAKDGEISVKELDEMTKIIKGAEQDVQKQKEKI